MYRRGASYNTFKKDSEIAEKADGNQYCHILQFQLNQQDLASCFVFLHQFQQQVDLINIMHDLLRGQGHLYYYSLFKDPCS